MGAVLDIFGAGAAAKAQTKAAKQAAQASQYAADQSIALQREQFDRVWDATAAGREASDSATRRLMEWSGLTPMGTDWEAYVRANPDLLAEWQAGRFGGGMSMSDVGQLHYSQYGQTEGRAAPTENSLTSQLRATPGYEFNFTEGQRALDASLAGRGLGRSGAAVRAAVEYGQNYGDRIFNQERNALQSLAGLGQNAVNTGAAAGSNMANASQNALTGNAQNLGSSYRDIADAQAGFWGTLSGTLGQKSVQNALGSFAKGFF